MNETFNRIVNGLGIICGLSLLGYLLVRVLALLAAFIVYLG